LAPEIKDWVAANKWYATDMELHDFALAYNDSYLKRHPDDLAGSLEATTRAVKKAFPEKFAGDAKPTVTKPGPSAVEGSTASSGAGKKFTVSRLSADQKLAHDQYIKAGTFDKAAAEAKMSPTEFYIKQLDEIGELSR
jgi:L-fucose isomerase-like protein